MQAKDELSALVFTRMLLARFNIDVSPKTVYECGTNLAGEREWCKVLTKSWSEDFVILLIVMLFQRWMLSLIERYPHRSFRKVGEQHRNKSQPRHWCFVALHEETFQSQSNSTRPSISLFGHNLSSLTRTKWRRWTQNGQEDAGKMLA